MYKYIMSRIINLLSFFAISFAAVTQFQYKSCGTATDLAKNIEMRVLPELPQKDYTLYLGADLSQQINQGTSKYSVTYNFIPLSPSTEDLCTEISKSNVTCPLLNHIDVGSKGSITDGLSGTVVIKNEWFDVSGVRILCMQFNIKM